MEENSNYPSTIVIHVLEVMMDIYIIHKYRAACSTVVKVLDLNPQGRWFNSGQCGHDKICTAVGPLSKALNPTLLQGVCLL